MDIISGYRWKQRNDFVEPEYSLIEARIYSPHAPYQDMRGQAAFIRFQRFVLQVQHGMAGSSGGLLPHEMDQLDELVEDAVTCESAAASLVRGWLLALSAGPMLGGVRECVLSAMLWPRGRGSTDDDWQMLGVISAHLNIPEALMRYEAGTGDPNRPLVVRWKRR